MEFLFEIIFEIVVEGAIEATSEKRVPMPLRIIAAVIVVGLFGGVIFLMIFTGFICLRNDEKGMAVLMFLLAAITFVGLTLKAVKVFKNRNL